ncbi:MAG TPA: hypothetical protein VG738_04975 [Chitinophagaceae bacterium]|nr:hypothetical protein [Chitinophagaceae bacterium]
MPNPAQFYLDHIYSTTLGFRATWDPGLPLKIGDVVKLDDNGVVNVFSSLDKMGITAEIRTDETATDLDYSSGSGIDITTKAEGAAPVAGSILSNADAGFTIQFKTDKSIVFKISGYKTDQIINLGDLEKSLLEKSQRGEWDKQLLIITHLITADTATIIISAQANTSLDLKAKADAGTAQLKITNASLGLTVARESGNTIKFIAQGGLTPLYKVMGLKSSLFGKKHLGVRDIAPTLENETFALQEFTPGEEQDDDDVLDITDADI